MCKRKLPKYQVGDTLEEWFEDGTTLFHLITKVECKRAWIHRCANGKRLRKPKRGYDRFYVLYCLKTCDTFTGGIREIEMRRQDVYCGWGWRKIA